MGRKGARKVSDGQAFESLIARIEHTLAPTGAVLKRRDSILDQDTGEPREIDLSIRYRIGLSNVLIIIECRDRKRRPDVTWVEQVADKRKGVGADRAIVVSSKPLGPNALAKARARGVEARACERLTDDEMLGWVREIRAEVLAASGILSSLMLHVEGADGAEIEPALCRRLDEAGARGLLGEATILFSADGSAAMNGHDLVDLALAQGWIPPDAPPVGGEIPTSHFAVTPEGKFVPTTLGLRRVLRVDIAFFGHKTAQEVQLNRHRLAAEHEHLVADGSWTAPDRRQRVELTFVASPAGELRVRVSSGRPKEDEGSRA